MERHRGSLVRLGFLVLASVAIIALDRADAPVVRNVREGAATVLSPAEGTADWVSRPFRNAWHGVTDYDELSDENAELREQLAETDAVEIAETDNERRLEELSELVDMPWAGDTESVVAQVVSGPRSNFDYAVQINKGSDHGMAEGMPVVSGRGLVGLVSQVTGKTATVELLTSSDLQVGVRVAENGELGTSRGQGRDEPLVVDSALRPDAEVEEGTALVTSGVDRSLYPEAIPVGRVASTQEGPGGLTLELLAEPLVDVHRLSYVAVLLWTAE
jgi:rod shape-determining protein MreC